MKKTYVDNTALEDWTSGSQLFVLLRDIYPLNFSGGLFKLLWSSKKLNDPVFSKD